MDRELGAQHWDAARYAKDFAFIPALGQQVLELAGARPGERVLDLGCGDGQLTQKLIDTGADVIGVDASAAMIELACNRGVDARHCDACALPFEAEFDLVFSNAVLHWIKDHDALLSAVRRALKPDGRFVAECGGFGNVAAITSTLFAVLNAHGYDGAALSPWVYPSIPEYKRRLTQAGFAVQQIELVDRPTPLPDGLEAWLDMFANPLLEPTGDNAKMIKSEVLRALKPNLCDENGMWFADYVRLRFVAIAH